MYRTREYRLAQRTRVIRRKKWITRVCRRIEDYYRYDGQYDKGKTHCSCGLCRDRDHRGGHLLTKAELIARDKAREELAQYEKEQGRALRNIPPSAVRLPRSQRGESAR